MMTIASHAVPLEAAREAARFGGKAVQLGALRRARLPAPEGLAIPWDAADRIASGEDAGEIVERAAAWGPVAVRSSAVGEDSASASFAGVHATHLNVAGAEAILKAILDVHASAHAESALAYRRRAGLTGDPRMGIVVQRFLHADVSGILFTKHPVTGEDERVIEASWGLGEAIVGGLVTPDHVRLTRTGALRELRVGDKDLAIVPLHGGGTHELSIPAELARVPCVDDATLRALLELATAAEELELVDGPLDLEWCVHGGSVHLLQLRPMTT